MVRKLSCALVALVTAIGAGGCSEGAETGGIAEGLEAAPGQQQQGSSVLLVTRAGGVTNESGKQVTLGVRLRHKPKSNVTIAVTSDAPSEGSALPASLVFTRENWKVAQTVTVRGVPDLVTDGDQPYGIMLSTNSTDLHFCAKTSRVGLTNQDVAPRLQRLALNAFQDLGHRFMAEHGEFFVYAAYPPDVTFDEFGQPSSPGQLWLFDRATGASRLITHDAAGGNADGNSDGPAVSGDGRYIAFRSSATNLGPEVTPFSSNVFVYTRATDSIELVSQNVAGQSAESFSLMGIPTISNDGRLVAFLSSSALVEGDDDGATDFFVRDRETGTTSLVTDSSGTLPDAAYKTDSVISGDGRFLAFVSGTAADPDNNKGVFVRDMSTGSLERADVSAMGVPGNGFVYGVDISDDGRYVTFASFADNLLPIPTNTMQVFVRDRLKDTIELASVNEDGEAGSGSSSEARLSSDGRFVVFLSWAPNLTSNPKASGYLDLYIHDRRSGRTSLLSVSRTGATGNGPSDSYGLAGDGSTLAFSSAASDLVPGDTTTFPPDMFVASVAQRVAQGAERRLGSISRR